MNLCNGRILLWQQDAPWAELCKAQPAPTLTPYIAPGSRGAVVVCPGGGYQMKAQHEGEPVALMLQNAGISAFVLDYRVAPCHHTTPLGDAKRAIRTVRAMGYQKVGILGFSAGGHLCCSAAMQFDLGDPMAEDLIERISSRPDAFVPCYAVVSFGKHTHQGSREKLLGEQATDEALIRLYSNELQVCKDTPPAFIWHTSDDGAVPVQNSLLLALALADAGIAHELHVYPNGRHGLGLAQELSDVSGWAGDCVRWLQRQGFGA